jgi:chloride channel protein, CIC family
MGRDRDGPAPIRRRLRVDTRRGLGPFGFALLSVVLGGVVGLGAFAFRALIGFLHNLFFLGSFSFRYDTLVHTPPSPWGLGVILVPAVGALVVVFLVKHFAPEAKGHGVPEVMDAIYYQKGVIRPIVALIKSLASATSIGSGGSVGREGPIIQIGAAFGSWSGRLWRVTRWELATLVAAGGGAGIAATFNTPIGGVLFAAEVLMPEISVRTLVPVALATATATYVGQFFFGTHPAFPVPDVHMPAGTEVALLPAYLGLGGLMALASVALIRGLYGAEDLFERFLPDRDYLRHVVGMLGVGVIAVLLMRSTGHYHVEGVGYATIADVLSGRQTAIGLLLVLAVLKLAATSLTLGSGASGGIFSPSLFVGATVGAAYGIALQVLFPGWQIDPVALALAGMAGMVAGATGAALTAIVMIFEMTLDYAVVLPMTLTVAASYGLRRLLLAESIYTMKLARRGHYMPKALQANASLVHHVSDLHLVPAAVLPADAPLQHLTTGVGPVESPHVVVCDRNAVVGVLSREWARAHAAELGAACTVGQAAERGPEPWVTVGPDATIFTVLAGLQAAHASIAVVLAPPVASGTSPQVIGLVTMAHLAEALGEGMEMFSDWSPDGSEPSSRAPGTSQPT